MSMEPNTLTHYGVLGMKWGVRRAPKKSVNIKRASKRTDWSDDAKEFHELRRKKVGQLSNAELKKMNERRNLEKNYRQLNPSALKVGIAFIASTAAAMNTVLNLYNNSGKLTSTGKSICQNILASDSKKWLL